MNSRQRVIDVIEHRRPDRIPIYGWVRANLDKPILGGLDVQDHCTMDELTFAYDLVYKLARQ